ncbi:MAG: DUF2235 domain-containing protein [Bacteroidia bacterium]|nr:DUF2235 domain-containing protein [Bacteroidia bacterium]
MKNVHHTQLGQSAGQKSRNLIFCFDGTWNDPSDKLEKGSDITNVLKTYNAAVQDKNQMAFYYSGVGTQGGKLDEIVGGATGAGAGKIRNQGYVDLVKNYRPGDKVFVFGFSRGAAIARLFANQVHQEGIPETLHFTDQKKKYKTQGKSTPVEISLLGLYDTVASFGIPVNIAGIPFQQIDLGRELSIPPNVKRVFHLVAFHEDRNTFRPTLVNHAENVEEIWFPGVHSNVGGGYNDNGISDIALKYMVERAAENGMLFKADHLAKIRPNFTGIVFDRLKEDYPLGLSPRDIVVIENGEASPLPPKIHYTVFEWIKRFANRTPPQLEKLKGNYIVSDQAIA